MKYCKYCNKQLKQTNSGYYVCSCKEAKESWKKGMCEQAKKQTNFYGYNSLEEAKRYWDINYIMKNFEKQEKDYPCYKNKRTIIAWLEQSPTSQTKSLRDFPNGEHNKGLDVQKSKISSPKLNSASLTSPNPNIKLNRGICSHALK